MADKLKELLKSGATRVSKLEAGLVANSPLPRLGSVLMKIADKVPDLPGKESLITDIRDVKPDMLLGQTGMIRSIEEFTAGTTGAPAAESPGALGEDVGLPTRGSL
jgi:hypothetical protein